MNQNKSTSGTSSFSAKLGVFSPKTAWNEGSGATLIEDDSFINECICALDEKLRSTQHTPQITPDTIPALKGRIEVSGGASVFFGRKSQVTFCKNSEFEKHYPKGYCIKEDDGKIVFLRSWPLRNSGDPSLVFTLGTVPIETVRSVVKILCNTLNNELESKLQIKDVEVKEVETTSAIKIPPHFPTPPVRNIPVFEEHGMVQMRPPAFPTAQAV